MQEPPPIPVLLDALHAFPAKLDVALADPDIDWECAPAEGEWCLTEVVCHLRDVEREVHQARFRALAAAEGAFLPGAVADEWVTKRRYREQHGPTALAQFLKAREETEQMLEAFDESYWQRQGQHAFFGPTTMQELLNLVVQHDQAHWEQVQALLQSGPRDRHQEAF
jgi:hypothetical protein